MNINELLGELFIIKKTAILEAEEKLNIVRNCGYHGVYDFLEFMRDYMEDKEYKPFGICGRYYELRGYEDACADIMSKMHQAFCEDSTEEKRLKCLIYLIDKKEKLIDEHITEYGKLEKILPSWEGCNITKNQIQEIIDSEEKNYGFYYSFQNYHKSCGESYIYHDTIQKILPEPQDGRKMTKDWLNRYVE